MVHISCTNRYDKVTNLEVYLAGKPFFVNPELLKDNLAALLNLTLVLATFINLHLNSTTYATVLKLYLCTERPATTKVIT